MVKSADSLPSFKSADLYTIDDDAILRDMLIAYNRFGDLAAKRVRTLSDARLFDGKYHRMYTIIKGMLSAGFDLSANIKAAYHITNYCIQSTPESVDVLIQIAKDNNVYFGQSPKTAIENVYNQLDTIRAMDDEDMTYANVRSLKGVGPKIGSWIMSLYYGDCTHYTLDRWMFRGMFGTSTATTHGIHIKLEKHILDIVYKNFAGVPPLVIQWSVWCYFRGNVWDNHDGVVRSDYR